MEEIKKGTPKKKVPVIAVVFLVLAVVVAIGLRIRGGSNLKVTPSTNGDKGIFTSVKDALTKKLTLYCEFTDERGLSVKSYIKNGAVRVTASGDGESRPGEMILKDQKMYVWDTSTKEGFVYNVDNNDGEGNSIGAQVDETAKSESYLSMIEQYKDSCKVTSIEDSFFETPTDIKFQDMSKLLEKMQKKIPQLPN